MGIGYVIVVAEEDEEKTTSILEKSGVKSYKIGNIKEGKEGICLV